MKQLRPTLLALFFIFSLLSCKKERIDAQIIGEWEIRSYAGGLLPGDQLPAGNGHIIKFTATEYEEFKDGKLVKTGTYQIIDEKFWAGDHRIIFDNDLTGLPQYLKVSDNKLTLFIGAPTSLDGLEVVYQRK